MQHATPHQLPTMEHTRSVISTADLIYNKKNWRWVQRPASKTKQDKVPVTVEVSWEAYTILGRPAPKNLCRGRWWSENDQWFRPHQVEFVSCLLATGMSKNLVEINSRIVNK